MVMKKFALTFEADRAKSSYIETLMQCPCHQDFERFQDNPKEKLDLVAAFVTLLASPQFEHQLFYNLKSKIAMRIVRCV